MLKFNQEKSVFGILVTKIVNVNLQLKEEHDLQNEKIYTPVLYLSHRLQCLSQKKNSVQQIESLNIRVELLSLNLITSINQSILLSSFRVIFSPYSSSSSWIFRGVFLPLVNLFGQPWHGPKPSTMAPSFPGPTLFWSSRSLLNLYCFFSYSFIL